MFNSIICSTDSENGDLATIQATSVKLSQQRKQSKKLAKTPLPRRRAKATPEIKWLKELICPFVYGERTPDGIYPSVNKQTFSGRWNLGYGLPSLPNYKLLDHFQGGQTLYFFGDGREKCKRTLVMIDIDVLKFNKLGSPEGAKQFAEHLKTIWPDLYFETSTNGKGIHGYIILLKSKIGAERTNAALKRLEKWLRSEAKRINADIEQVEIKGTCLDLTLQGRIVETVKYGSFAKLPRDISRFDEWQNTSVLRVRDLETSLFDEGAVPEMVPVVQPPVSVVKASDVSVISPLPISDTSKKTKPTVSSSISGSVSGKFINEEELAGTSGRKCDDLVEPQLQRILQMGEILGVIETLLYDSSPETCMCSIQHIVRRL